MKNGKLGANAMKRVAAGARLPTPWCLSLRNGQTIDPTTAWADFHGNIKNANISSLSYTTSQHVYG